MILHPEFKRSTLQFWRQLEMFHVFIRHPELGVSVAYELDPVRQISLYSDYCAIEVPEKPTVMFQATVIDSYALEVVESLIHRFTFNTPEQSYVATLGLLTS